MIKISLKKKRLTSQDIAKFYNGGAVDVLYNRKFRSANFRFEDGHFFKVEGDELAVFKNDIKSFNVVAPTVNVLYLWTERGAARHAKRRTA